LADVYYTCKIVETNHASENQHMRQDHEASATYDWLSLAAEQTLLTFWSTYSTYIQQLKCVWGFEKLIN